MSIPSHYPERPRRALERLIEDLAPFAPEPHALVVYGSLARGTFREGESDVNLALVLENTSLELLGRLHVPLRAAWRAVRIEPFIVRVSEIPRLAEEPYDVAYLAGGARGVTDAAVAALVHAGRAMVEKDRLTKTPSTGGGAFIQPGVYRQVQALEKHPVELVIIAALASRGSLTLRDARAASRMTAEGVGTKLATKGNFVLSDATRRVGVALGVIPLCGLFALGVIKLILGVDRGRPIFFLLVLLAGTAYWLYRQGLSFPRLTFTGQAALDELRTKNAALQTAMRAAPEQVTSREAALGYGLFGTTVLGGSLGALATPMFLGTWRLFAKNRAAKSPRRVAAAQAALAEAALAEGDVAADVEGAADESDVRHRWSRLAPGNGLADPQEPRPRIHGGHR